jgi:hypothetical protein
MTLENCIKCKNHVSYINGYIVCNFWKQLQQHVTNRSRDGAVSIVGCAVESNKPD